MKIYVMATSLFFSIGNVLDMSFDMHLKLDSHFSGNSI